MKFKRWKTLTAISILSLITAVGCSKDLDNTGSQESAERVEGESDRVEEERDFVAIGKEAPLFELKSLEGETYSLEDFRGRPVLLNFYSKDCRFCLDKFPELNRLYEENSDWAEIMAINVGEPAGYSEDLRDEYDLKFPMLLDENIATSTDYLVRSIPYTVIIDGEGMVTTIRVGPMDYEDMLAELESAKK